MQGYVPHRGPFKGPTLPYLGFLGLVCMFLCLGFDGSVVCSTACKSFLTLTDILFSEMLKLVKALDVVYDIW